MIFSSGHLRCSITSANVRLAGADAGAYAAKLVSFKLLRLSSTEPSLIDQVRELLLHELVDLCNGLLEPFLGCASDVEVERWGLLMLSPAALTQRGVSVLTAAVAIVLSG